MYVGRGAEARFRRELSGSRRSRWLFYTVRQSEPIRPWQWYMSPGSNDGQIKKEDGGRVDTARSAGSHSVSHAISISSREKKKGKKGRQNDVSKRRGGPYTRKMDIPLERRGCVFDKIQFGVRKV